MVAFIFKNQTELNQRVNDLEEWVFSKATNLGKVNSVTALKIRKVFEVTLFHWFEATL